MPKDKRFIYTGVRASELEEAQMANPPACEAKDLPGNFALPTQADIMHACALAHGLPDIYGFYAYDFEEHQFLCLSQSCIKEPVLDLLQERIDAEDDTELEDAGLDAALREGFEE